MHLVVTVMFGPLIVQSIWMSGPGPKPIEPAATAAIDNARERAKRMVGVCFFLPSCVYVHV
jgi:hypothetical protein